MGQTLLMEVHTEIMNRFSDFFHTSFPVSPPLVEQVTPQAAYIKCGIKTDLRECFIQETRPEIIFVSFA